MTAGVDVDPARAAHLQRALRAWFATTARDLPWRHTRDPWAVLVAELMLQQTQVARVLPRWTAFLDDLPTPAAAAAAGAAELIRRWQGLGYNRRALHLHRCAVVVTDQHDGTLPPDLDALLALPGVGPYTARAVLAFAFEQDVGVVDTNAARVLARAVAGRRLTAREVQGLADHLVPDGAGWVWNQAVLDLGATVCTKRSPRCDDCPLRASCAWQVDDPGGEDPAAGSAGVSGTQSTFAGSDRQGRGRLVAAMTARGPVDDTDLPGVMGWPTDRQRATRVAVTLLADGLAERTGTTWHLPTSTRTTSRVQRQAAGVERGGGGG